MVGGILSFKKCGFEAPNHFFFFWINHKQILSEQKVYKPIYQQKKKVYNTNSTKGCTTRQEKQEQPYIKNLEYGPLHKFLASPVPMLRLASPISKAVLLSWNVLKQH